LKAFAEAAAPENHEHEIKFSNFQLEKFVI